MNTTYLFQEPDKIKELSERIRLSKEVSKFDNDEEPAAWNIAYTFSELEGSFRKFLEHYLVKLDSEDLEPNEIHDILLEVGEEFRHILYHLGDAPFYRYIFKEE